MFVREERMNGRLDVYLLLVGDLFLKSVDLLGLLSSLEIDCRASRRKQTRRSRVSERARERESGKDA